MQADVDADADHHPVVPGPLREDSGGLALLAADGDDDAVMGAQGAVNILHRRTITESGDAEATTG
ncbi:hypothetical protein SHIRM173S_01996 [Streptomyces hirsutus]